MPRKTRRELVLVDEQQEQEDRDLQCQKLEKELRQTWREVTFLWRSASGQSLPLGVVKNSLRC